MSTPSATTLSLNLPLHLAYFINRPSTSSIPAQRAFKPPTPLPYPNFFNTKALPSSSTTFIPKFLLLYQYLSFIPMARLALRLTTFIPTFLFHTNISPSYESHGWLTPQTNVTFSSYPRLYLIPTWVHHTKFLV